MQKQVSALGYAAETAEDGTRGAEQMALRPFDLILTDCNMPAWTATTLAREIRARESREGRTRTPMIACTANALSGEAENCFAAGMDDYLAKPVELRELDRKLGKCAGPGTADRAARRGGAAGGTRPAQRRSSIARHSPSSRRRRGLRARAARAIPPRRTERTAEALEPALARRDIDEVSRAAHASDGFSRSVGAMPLLPWPARRSSAPPPRHDCKGRRRGHRASSREFSRLEARIAEADRCERTGMADERAP